MPDVPHRCSFSAFYFNVFDIFSVRTTNLIFFMTIHFVTCNLVVFYPATRSPLWSKGGSFQKPKDLLKMKQAVGWQAVLPGALALLQISFRIFACHILILHAHQILVLPSSPVYKLYIPDLTHSKWKIKFILFFQSYKVVQVYFNTQTTMRSRNWY